MAASYQFIGHSREGGNPVRTMWFPALIQGVRIQGAESLISYTPSTSDHQHALRSYQQHMLS